MIEEKLEELYKEAERYFLMILINSEEPKIRVNPNLSVRFGKEGNLLFSPLPKNKKDLAYKKIFLIEGTTLFEDRKEELLKEILDYIEINEKTLVKHFKVHRIFDITSLKRDRPGNLTIYYTIDNHACYISLHSLYQAYNIYLIIKEALK